MTDTDPTAAGASTPRLNLALDVQEAKAELALPEPEPTDELRSQADAQVEHLLSIDPTDEDARTAAREAVDSMGRDLQTRSAGRSRMMSRCAAGSGRHWRRRSVARSMFRATTR